MKLSDLPLYIQKIQIECLPCKFNCPSTKTRSSCNDFSLSSAFLESDYDELDEPIRKELVIRSDISKIQSRLFDILTVRIINENDSFTQMYYDHEEIDNYVRGMHLNQLSQVSFPVKNIAEFKKLEQKLIFGKLDPNAKVFLPNNDSLVAIKPPYSAIVVKAHFVDPEKRIQFTQKISKSFQIVDESKSNLNHL